MLLNLKNRVAGGTSAVVFICDVNVLVLTCLIGLFFSVFGIRNTKEMNDNLDKVRKSAKLLLFLSEKILSLSHSVV